MGRHEHAKEGVFPASGQPSQCVANGQCFNCYMTSAIDSYDSQCANVAVGRATSGGESKQSCLHHCESLTRLLWCCFPFWLYSHTMIMNMLQLRSGGAEIFGSDLTLGEKVALKSQNFAVQANACLAICQPHAWPLLQQACLYPGCLVAACLSQKSQMSMMHSLQVFTWQGCRVEMATDPARDQTLSNVVEMA